MFDEKINRRTFLKQSVLIPILTLGLSKLSFSGQKEKYDIAVAHGKNVEKKLEDVVDGIGGIKKFVKKNARVLIKPNISFARRPEVGANTSPEVLDAVIKLCKKAGAKEILVVDCVLADPKQCLEMSGAGRVAEDNSVRILILNGKPLFEEVEVPNGNTLKSIAIYRELKEFDAFIDLPTAKHHGSAGVSLSMKNLMGLIRDRGVFHSLTLHKAIPEMCLVIKPTLTIMDATRALTAHGPSGPEGPEKTVRLDTIVAGTDMVAVDSYTVSLTEWAGRKLEGRNVAHIKYANEIGLGESDISKLNIIRI